MSDVRLPSVDPAPQRSGAAVPRGRWRLLGRRLRRDRGAVVGAVGSVLLVVAAVFGPHVGGWGVRDIDPTAFLSGPSVRHPFGTTQVGRDVVALTLAGLGRSLAIGVVAASLQTGLAAIVGAAAGLVGGRAERVVLRGIDLLLIIPSLLIVATLMSGFGAAGPSWLLVAVLIGLFGWMVTGRVVHALTLALKQEDFVVAARYLGQTRWRIVRGHLLPNLASLLIVDWTLNVGYAILAETGLSFLGFGVQPPDVSLGRLIGDGARLATTQPWVFLPPSAVLVLAVLCLNAVGQGLRSALDPTGGGRS